MTEFVSLIWQSNGYLSGLIVAIVLVRYLIKRISQSHILYLLWACIPLAIISMWVAQNVDWQSSSVVEAAQIVQSFVVEPIADTVEFNASIASSEQVVTAASFSDNLILLAVIVALMLVLRLAFQHIRLRSELRRISTHSDLAKTARYPIVVVNDRTMSPSAYGFFTPTIYFPKHLINQLDDEQIELIIKHEEHHIRQGHLWSNLIFDLMVCLYWFNPLMYVARHLYRHDQELYCDYLVLESSHSVSAHAYGHALLQTLSVTHSVSLLCSFNSFKTLEERIMNLQTTLLKRSKLLLIVSALAITGVTSLMAVNAGEKKVKLVEGVLIDEKSDVIKIKKNGNVWLQEDGKRYKLEGDKKLPLSEEENAKFDQELANIPKFDEDDHKTIRKVIRIDRSDDSGDVGDIEKRIKIITDGVVITDEHELSEEEMARIEKEIEKSMAHLEGLEHFKNFDIELTEHQKEMLEKEHQLINKKVIVMGGDRLHSHSAEADIVMAEAELERLLAENKISKSEHKALSKKLNKARKQYQQSRETLGKQLKAITTEIESK